MILACHLGRYIPPSQATYACDPGRSPTGDAATWGREKEAYARAGYPLATAELPDYLPLVLEFALEVPEEGSPMLAENRAAIEVIRRSLRHDGSLYAHLIEALIFFLPALT